MTNKQQAGNVLRKAKSAEVWRGRRSKIVAMYKTKSQQTIADHYGLSLAGMQKAMARLGIKSRSKGRTGKANGRYRHGRASVLYRAMIEKNHCATCGTTQSLCVHHKNGDHFDNRKMNLRVLCMACHSRMHKQAYWDRKRGLS